MTELQIGWVTEMADLPSDPAPRDIGDAVLAACGGRYATTVAEHGLLEFKQHSSNK